MASRYAHCVKFPCLSNITSFPIVLPLASQHFSTFEIMNAHQEFSRLSFEILISSAVLVLTSCYSVRLMSHRSQQNTLNDFLENLLRSSQSKSTFTRLEEDETVIRITTLPPPQWWCTQDISYASFTTHLHLQERKIEQKMYIAYFVPMSDKLTRKLMWKLSCLEELEYFIKLSF